MSDLCDKSGCNNPGILYPVIQVRPRKYYGPPSEMILKLRICDQCALQSKPEDFISDKGWQQIEDTFVALNIEKPARKKTTLKFIPIEDYPIKD